MNWLFDNPLANLPGTYFLMLYAAVITTALVVYGLVKAQADKTAQLPLPPVPLEPDPFEIAYLRGGANELARSVVFALVQKGVLQITNGTTNSWIGQTGAQPEKHGLKPIERRGFEWFSASRQPKELFGRGGLIEELKPFTTTYDARLQNSQFMVSDETRARLNRLSISIALLILGLGAYKLTAALLNDYTNVLFLIMMGIAGNAMLHNIGKLPRLTKLGRAYLERMQLAYEKLKYPVVPLNQMQPAYANANFGAVDPMLLAVGVFGATAVGGAAFDGYNQAFYKSHQTTLASGTSCGSGCGTSWDSSSSSGSDGGSGGDGGSSCGGGGGGCGGGCS